MTLRARLLSLTLSMVAVVVLTLVALNVNSLVATWLDVALERSEIAGRQVQSFMLRRIEERAAQMQPAPPGTLDDTKRIWSRIVAEDADLSALLEQTMAQSRSIVEIDVAGEDGMILASSSPVRRGTAMIAKQDLRLLREASPVGRITAILSSHDDYETRVPLGIAGQKTPVFTIQILVSPVLLRAATAAGVAQCRHRVGSGAGAGVPSGLLVRQPGAAAAGPHQPLDRRHRQRQGAGAISGSPARTGNWPPSNPS